LKKLVLFALVFVLLFFAPFSSVKADDGTEEIMTFDVKKDIKFVQKVLEPDKINKYLEDYNMVFIYQTTNKDEYNIPVGQFIFKYDGMTLYKDYYTIEENSKNLKMQIRDFVTNASNIAENPLSVFGLPDYLNINELAEKTTYLRVKLLSNPSNSNDATQLSLITDEWAMNPVVHQAEKSFAPYGKMNYSIRYFEQVSYDHYFTRVENSVEFIPGYALYNLGISGYTQFYLKDSAYHKTQLLTYYTPYNDTGDEPKGIDYWPVNGPATYTVTSGWGLSVDIGYSQKDGFSGNIVGNFSRSTTYELTSPSMNATTITIGKQYGWYYGGFTTTTRVQTIHHYPGIMVEQKTDSGFDGDFGLYQNFYMKVYRSIFYQTHELTWNVGVSKNGQ